jgi:hypothetical protein
LPCLNAKAPTGATPLSAVVQSTPTSPPFIDLGCSDEVQSPPFAEFFNGILDGVDGPFSKRHLSAKGVG